MSMVVIITNITIVLAHINLKQDSLALSLVLGFYNRNLIEKFLPQYILYILIHHGPFSMLQSFPLLSIVHT